jgi:hypothetical protein
MSGAWNTAYGRRRVRQEPPTLEEAVEAAQGLTDDLAAQVEIAASLMGVPADATVKAAVRKALGRTQVRATVAAKGRGGIQRAVVVERKVVRRPGTVKRFDV